MKSLRRATALLLILVMALSLSSCAGVKDYLWPEPTTAAPGAPTSNITVIPGSTIYDIAKELEKGKVCSAESFLKAANNIPAGYDTLLDGLGDVSDYVFAAEGYILPETYNMFQNRDGEYAIRYFLNYSQSQLNELANKAGQTVFSRAEELDMNMREVFTLASIIQSEANLGTSEDDYQTMRMVSSVFHNRLDSPWNYPYIGSDATRKYIQVKLGDYFVEQGVYKYGKDSTDKNKVYEVVNKNTQNKFFDGYCTNDEYDHKIEGLPIAPICSPTTAAIKAALWPEDSDYYFFFTDIDNKFHFYTNYEDFQKEWNTKYKH
ncbi:MAG: endolytic transglycosylase MltG [Clostridia bacterium]|nr:endolytic transglycosylase MltG [Clostridia bacterium]